MGRVRVRIGPVSADAGRPTWGCLLAVLVALVVFGAIGSAVMLVRALLGG